MRPSTSALAAAVANALRRGVGRLADRHRHDGLADRLQPVGLGEDVHGVKGLDIAALRDRYRHSLSLFRGRPRRTNARLVWGSQVHDVFGLCLSIAPLLVYLCFPSWP